MSLVQNRSFRVTYLSETLAGGLDWHQEIWRDNPCHFFFPPKINVGCSTDSSSADPVRLEFSRDFGATWHLLLPLCYHSSVHVSSLCSTEHHPGSTYYAGTTQGWRREVVHFGKLHLCG